MNTEIIHGSAVFDNLATEWDELAQQGTTDTPFQTWAYQRAWWHHLGVGELVSVIVRNGTGELVAIGCFYLLDGVVHFNGCVEETDYLDLIVSAGQATEAWTAILNTLLSPDFPAWTSIDLCNIPANSPSRDILASLATEHSLTHHTEVQEVCPIIPLPDSFDSYLSSLDKKQRHEVRRKLRRANGAEAELELVANADTLAQDIDEFLELLQKSTFEKEAWLNDGRRAVFHATAKAALEAGTLQLLFLKVEGQRAAALFNFAYKGRVWVYNSGLDPAAFGHLSSGVVLTALAIEKGIEDGNSEFDFLRGNETYKYRFGAVDTTIHRVVLTK